MLTVDGVSKTFRAPLEPAHSLKEATFQFLRGRLRHKHFEALHDIHLQVSPGEALGLIGPNGSGKSTLFKIISGIIRPSSGKVDCRGRVSPLIELSAGFHPELTGIENIYLNGYIHGLVRRQIDERLPAIRDFADIGDFVHAPARTLSSGMMARLAFALAINVDAEIILIDEVLAVGDFEFQQRCIQRIKGLKASGTAVIFVSHQLPSVAMLCDRVIALEKGRMVDEGSTEAVIQRFKERSADHAAQHSL